MLRGELSIEFQQEYIRRILDFANEHGDIKTLSITPMNFGKAGFSKIKCAELILRTIVAWFCQE